MSAKLEVLREQKVARVAKALQKARSLRNTRSIIEHIEDVDGDWLENWTDTQNTLANDEADKGALTL
jgi:hypothetical protein